MVKQIIICADDFAQNLDVSEGILLLARHNRINAISCIVNTPYWQETSSELFSYAYNGYIGLHVNLTFGQPLSSAWRKYEGEEFVGLSHLLKKLYLRKIKPEIIEAEIKAQIDVFTHSMHIYPDFIDGHQHVQQFLGVREALFNVHTKQMEHISSYEEDLMDENTDASSVTFFRNTSNGFKDLLAITGFPKSQVLSLLGGCKFKRLLINKKIPTNASFSGIYNFRKSKNYRKYFQSFLKKTQNGGIIMCHPGIYSNDLTDPLHLHRHHELTYLNSDVFLTDMEDNDFLLAFKNGG